MKKTFLLLSCIFLLTSCAYNESNETEYSPSTEAPSSCLPENEKSQYIPYAEIPADYSLENAKSDGLVVYEGRYITSGQSVWDSFVTNTQNGDPCMVRLAFYYTLSNPSSYSPEYYFEIKENDPPLFLDLYFDGEIYTIYYVFNEKEYCSAYNYLKRFEEITGMYTQYTYYMLVNDNKVTIEQINTLNPDPRDYIDHATVYIDYKYDPQHPLK